MTTRETAALTFAMMRSGETWDLSRHGFVADKHSTGGVGDKATLVLAPLLAAVGVKAGMMSGRGLGHTGGTLDKLEAIPGFRTALPKADFDRLLDTVGCALIGQTDSIAPADRRLYALRDVTGTVESIPLITASILSKKLATGAHAVVFDVKTGNGAFMADPKDAEKLGRGARRDDARDGPQGLRLPHGDGPPDRRGRRERERGRRVDPDARAAKGRRTCARTRSSSAPTSLLAAGLETNPKDARRRLNAALADGRALEVFAKLIAAQGGDATVCDDVTRLPQPVSKQDVPAPEGGVVTRIATREVGLLAIELGCGRAKRDDVDRPGLGLPCEEEARRRRRGGRAAPRRRARKDREAEAGLLRPSRGLLHHRTAREPRGDAALRRRKSLKRLALAFVLALAAAEASAIPEDPPPAPPADEEAPKAPVPGIAAPGKRTSRPPCGRERPST